MALATVAAFAAASSSPRAQSPSDSDPTIFIKSPLLTTNRVLLAGLDRIARGSHLWREAIEGIRKTGRHVLVVTPDDPLVPPERDKKDCVTFDSGQIAEVVPVLRKDARVTLVAVVVNLRLIEEIHDARLSVRRDLEADVDRILVHEIYGHAIPYLLVGSLAGRCPDPRTGERPSDACAIRRENAVRAELGLGRRTDYSLSSLALARGF